MSSRDHNSPYYNGIELSLCEFCGENKPLAEIDEYGCCFQCSNKFLKKDDYVEYQDKLIKVENIRLYEDRNIKSKYKIVNRVLLSDIENDTDGFTCLVLKKDKNALELLIWADEVIEF